MRLKLILIALLILTGVACSRSSSEPPKPEVKTETKEPAAPPTEKADDSDNAKSNEIPEGLMTAFPNAQEIARDEKTLTPDQSTEIEKESGSEFKKDFHAYIAYGTKGGKRASLGTASVLDLKEDGEPVQLVVNYTNDLKIKKVTKTVGAGDFLRQEFLDQFSGKRVDQPFELNKDVKYDGINPPAAEMVTRALKRDLLAMRALYGK